MIEIKLEGEAEQKLKQLVDFYNDYSPDDWSFEDITILAIENLYSEKLREELIQFK